MLDEFTKRGILAYVGFSVGIMAIAQAMIENGSATSRNPAWHLISSIRSVFIWSWVLLLILAALSILLKLASDWRLAAKQAEERRKEMVMQENREADHRKLSLEKQIRDREIEEMNLAEAHRQAKAREEQVRRELERKSMRSPEDAINAALDDF